MTACQRFMIQPKRRLNPTQDSPKATGEGFAFRFPQRPQRSPVIPQPNICHGVHGPCPRKTFETKALVHPTRKPGNGPKTSPQSAVRKVTGWMLGRGAKTTRDMAVKALRVEISAICLVPMTLASK